MRSDFFLIRFLHFFKIGVYITMFLILRTFLFCFFILMEEFSTQDLNLEETGTSTQLRSIQ